MRKELKNHMIEKDRDSIFISHSHYDEPIASIVHDYLMGCGVLSSKIFCTSIPGNDVDTNISREIKQKLKESAVNILILSAEYYKSPFCLNEAGVIWYLEEDAAIIPIGLPEIAEGDMVGFIDRNQVIRRLNNDTDISKIYDIVSEKLSIQNVGHTVITQQSKKLKEKYESVILQRESNSCRKIKEIDDSLRENDNKYINPVAQAIADAGGIVHSINELAERTGMTTNTVKRKLYQGIETGEIEVIGSNRRKSYRIM